MMHRSNVLSRRSRPTKMSYRAAIKKIVLDLQARYSLNDEELAERVGCSAPTIANARNMRTNLDGVTLANIEHEFGPGAIDPVLALSGSRGVPMGAHCDSDANPALKVSEALTAIIATQQPESHDGAETSDKEAAEILPSLREGRRALDSLIVRGERFLHSMMGGEVA